MIFWSKKPKPAEGAVADESAAGEAAPKAGQPQPEPARAEPRTSGGEPAGGWGAKFRSALTKTNDWLHTDIRDLLKTEGRLVDEEFTGELYEILVRTDMGGETARKAADRIGRDYRARKVHMPDILRVIGEEVQAVMQDHSVEVRMAESGPTVILVVGVNGAGKTTSIAKLAYRYTQQGKRVILGAGDTFRAAAVAQLKVWAERIGCDIITGDGGSDPASVAFKAAQAAREGGYDVCIIDTAGRLQTQTNLMQQLDKIRRVVAKQIEGAPHEALLVLDATAGQNAISQARGFSGAAGCTGIVLAKLDGSAKGGVVVPIAKEFSLPVKFVGLGEKLADLQPFEPKQFTAALLDLGPAG